MKVCNIWRSRTGALWLATVLMYQLALSTYGVLSTSYYNTRSVYSAHSTYLLIIHAHSAARLKTKIISLWTPSVRVIAVRATRVYRSFFTGELEQWARNGKRVRANWYIYDEQSSSSLRCSSIIQFREIGRVRLEAGDLVSHAVVPTIISGMVMRLREFIYSFGVRIAWWRICLTGISVRLNGI